MYIDGFTHISIEVDGAQECLQCWIFENNLLSDHSFKKKLGMRKVKYVQEMLTMVEPFMLLEENLATCLDNPMSSESHFGCHLKKNLTRAEMTLTITCKGNMTDSYFWRFLVKESIKSV